MVEMHVGLVEGHGRIIPFSSPSWRPSCDSENGVGKMEGTDNADRGVAKVMPIATETNVPPFFMPSVRLQRQHT